MSATNEESEVDRQITAAVVDGNGRAPCDGCISKEGQCRWEEIKDELLPMAQELEKNGSKKSQIRFSLYKQYNYLTHGAGNDRTALPTCCEKHIKKEYPDEAYRGFQKKN
jgi:hypothetical protein